MNGEQPEKEPGEFWVQLRLDLLVLTLANKWEDPSGAKGQGGQAAGLSAHAWLTCPGVVMSREQTQMEHGAQSPR